MVCTLYTDWILCICDKRLLSLVILYIYLFRAGPWGQTVAGGGPATWNWKSSDSSNEETRRGILQNNWNKFPKFVFWPRGAGGGWGNPAPLSMYSINLFNWWLSRSSQTGNLNLNRFEQILIKNIFISSPLYLPHNTQRKC